MLVVVDLANVLGSRPDGWWRDRAGATAALVAAIRARAWSADAWAAALDVSGPVEEVLLVAEGAARRLADAPLPVPSDSRPVAPSDPPQGPPPGLPSGSPSSHASAVPAGAPQGSPADGRPTLRVVAASGSGDDAVVAVVAARPAGSVVVVTSDRGLQERVRGHGAAVRSAGRFRARLER